ncbi:MAG: Histidine kinase, partial [Prosthecobacter sp.]|nr:Histidine kinase [Prosthecobacter sp.]
MSAQEQQRLGGSLVIMVDRHGIIHTVHGGWERFDAACGPKLPLPESSSSCFDFFTSRCAPLFDGAADWSHTLRQVLDHQSAGTRIESCLLAASEERWIEVTIVPLPVHDSAGALITCIDVTPRKQAEVELRNREAQRKEVEERLHQSEATMATAQRISHFGSWELDLVDMDDLGSNALRWSDEIFRIFGHEVGAIEASNENFFRAVHPDDRELISVAVNEAIRTHGRYSIDHRIILPNGETRHIHEDAQIFLDEQTGRPMRMVGTAHDITERKLAEEAFKTSEFRFRHAFANASVGFAITDMRGTVLHINTHFCHITGYAEEGMIGRSFASITHPDDIAREQELNQRLMNGEINDFIVEKRYLCKNGEVAWVENSVSVIRDESGAALNTVVLCKDITQSLHNQKQLRLLETCVAHLNDIVLITEAEPLDEPGPRI